MRRPSPGTRRGAFRTRRCWPRWPARPCPAEPDSCRSETRGRESFGDVARTDRTVKLAFGRRVRADRDLRLGELFLTGVGIGTRCVGLRLVLGAALFELGGVGLGGRHGLALRNQIVADRKPAAVKASAMSRGPTEP